MTFPYFFVGKLSDGEKYRVTIIVIKKILLLLPDGEASFWSVSVGEGIPQRHQGYQTQHGQIWACTSAELRGGTRNASVVADEVGSFIRQDLLLCTMSGLYGSIIARFC